MRPGATPAAVHDSIVIGAGHNALAAAYYLAKGGRRPLVLERQTRVGGGAVTTEIHPGFTGPGFSHEILLDEQVARDLDLASRGVEWLRVPALACAPSPDGPPLVLYEDIARTVESLRPICASDADAYGAFRTTIAALASVVGATFGSPPPDIDDPSARDFWQLLRTGRRFRALGRRDGYRLLRYLSMPVGDLMAEWFHHEGLRSMLAGPALSGTMLGPRSAGSALVLLLRAAALARAGGRVLRARDGPGAVTGAMAAAAREAGAEIRTGVAVERVLVRGERVVGVVANGDEIACRTVVSGLDPKTTFLSLVDAGTLAPEFASKVRHYRASGTVAKVNLALSSLPAFHGVAETAALAGRIHIGRDLDYLEQAFDPVKYGELPRSPWLDMTIPSILDTDLAPKGAHVASIYVHYVPYALRALDWTTARDVLLAATLAALEECAPEIRSLVVSAQVLPPPELEAQIGISGGHIFHGELSVDQLYAMRPLLGHSGYITPIAGLFLCGAGTHPGGFMSGASGRLAARAVLDGPAT